LPAIQKKRTKNEDKKESTSIFFYKVREYKRLHKPKNQNQKNTNIQPNMATSVRQDSIVSFEFPTSAEIALTEGERVNEVIRQARLKQAIEAAPVWPLRQDSIMSFEFPYGARELIAERNRVGEIRVLREAMEEVTAGDSKLFSFLGVPLTFKEAFIYSDEMRRALNLRVFRKYDLHWKNHIVGMHAQDLPQTKYTSFETHQQFEAAVATWSKGVAQYYQIAQSMMEQHLERLLLMQALAEELKPETRELVESCENFEELDRSMLA
jgi:hypothetical protein